MARKDDLKQLIIRNERRLQKLKEQQASFGLHTPPHILIEIEDAEAELEKLQAELEALQQPHTPLTLYYKYQDQPEKTYRATEDEVIIGRPKNIPIHLDLSPDLKVSRPHVRLFYDLSAWWIEDLRSNHGTQLNGQTITKAETLSPGDELKLGDTLLRVEFQTFETLPPPGFLESHTPVDEIEPPPTVSEDKRTELLARMATSLASAPTRQAMLERFIEIIGEAFPQAEHRAIVIIDEDKELIPWASWPPGPAHVSFTLARRAIISKEALHWVRDFSTEDGQVASLHDTTAALCAPMILNGRVIGVVYVDTSQPDTVFGENERDLLSEVATTLARLLQAFDDKFIPSFPAVFVSYASPDRAFVNRLAADLRRRRIKVWFDERLQVGDDRQQEISRAIKMTDGFVLVLSPDSVASTQVQGELNIALQEQKKIFPLMYRACEPPETIKNLVYLDVSSDHYQDGLAELVEVIKRIPKSELMDMAGVAASESPPVKPAIKVPVMRVVSAPLTPPQAGSKSPNYILMLAANPRDTDQLRLSEEARTIEERLREAEFRDRFEVVTKWAVRQTDLSAHLLRFKPHIVHFSGHGSKSGKIIVEDETGHGQTVTPEALRQLFRILKDNIRCVILNACLSLSQAEAIIEEIDCVVGMSAKIGDEAAIRFAGGFYRALGYGRSVQTAFDLGCNEIGLANLDQDAIPKLLVRSGVNAANLTFI